MRLIDTHTHLYGEEYDADIQETLSRCLHNHVDTLIFPAIDPLSYDRQSQLTQTIRTQLPEMKAYEMMGLHPTSIKEDWEQLLSEAEKRLFNQPEHYVAVGEIGLDYYWDRTYEKEQIIALEQQMAWAEQLNLPVCLHVRKAYEEILHIVQLQHPANHRGVMHCFGGSVNQAERSIAQGFYIGIGGVVTFKNAGMADVVRAIPLERILLETDSPYLTPVPFRGKRNESAHISLIAQKVAELKNISIEEVAEVTTHNALTLFQIK